MTPLVQIDHLNVRIPTERGWVHSATDVCLNLEAGRVHALVGESGCGKSQLALSLLGMTPSSATVTGRLVIDGVDMLAGGRSWQSVRGRLIGLVTQSAATSFTPTRTLGSQVAELVRCLDGSRSAEELCESVGLDAGTLEAFPHELSGGMITRMALAAALAGDPRVLIADEVTAPLDVALRDRVLALLRAQADAGVAVLVITHDLASLIDTGIADQVSVMYASRIVESGLASDVLSSPQHAYTQALLRALPRNGMQAVGGEPPSLLNLADDTDFSDRLVTV